MTGDVGPDVDDAEDRPTHIALETLLLTLPEADQLLIQLRFREELNHAQIAQQLGVSEVACRKRLERVLAALRKRADQPDLRQLLEGEN